MQRLTEIVLGPLLDWLGISRGQQFVLCIICLIAGFIVYAIKQRDRDLLLSGLYVVLSLALFLFLFTESPLARRASLIVLAASIAGCFSRDAYRRRQRKPGRS